MPANATRSPSDEALGHVGLVEPHAEKNAGTVDDGDFDDGQSGAGLLDLDGVDPADDGRLGSDRAPPASEATSERSR